MSAMRRPTQDGQKPRPLHEKATSRSTPHCAQCTRTKPNGSRPHSRYARSSRTTKRGTLRPLCSACDRNVSRFSRTARRAERDQRSRRCWVTIARPASRRFGATDVVDASAGDPVEAVKQLAGAAEQAWSMLRAGGGAMS